MLVARTRARMQFVQVLLFLHLLLPSLARLKLLLYPVTRSTLILNCISLGALPQND